MIELTQIIQQIQDHLRDTDDLGNTVLLVDTDDLGDTDHLGDTNDLVDTDDLADTEDLGDTHNLGDTDDLGDTNFLGDTDHFGGTDDLVDIDDVADTNDLGGTEHVVDTDHLPIAQPHLSLVERECVGRAAAERGRRCGYERKNGKENDKSGRAAAASGICIHIYKYIRICTYIYI